MLVLFMVRTQDTLLRETFVNLKYGKILENGLSFAAIDIWKDLPSSLKDKRRLRGKKEATTFSRQACFVNRFTL